MMQDENHYLLPLIILCVARPMGHDSVRLKAAALDDA